MVEDPVKINIGEREYYYRAELHDERWVVDRVRLYDKDGFIVDFLSMEEMEEYLGHACPSEINKELDVLKRFRKKCKILEELGDYTDGLSMAVYDEEKSKTQEIFWKRFRMLKGDLTTYQFSKAAGINMNTTQMILTNRRLPGMHQMKRIADRCGVTVDWLLGR